MRLSTKSKIIFFI